MDLNKLAYYQKLQQQVNSNAAYLKAREQALNAKQKLINNGLMPNTGARTLRQNLGASLDASMVPGNVGDINSVIWPFFFITDFHATQPNENFNTGFSITQEASFVWMSFSKVVLVQDPDTGDQSYIDPDVAGSAGHAFNLQITMRDGVSSRDFQNTPFDLDTVGNPRFPMKYPKPSLFLPNATIEIAFQNNDPDLIYVPWVCAFGYRIRIENAQQILSMVTSG